MVTFVNYVIANDVTLFYGKTVKILRPGIFR